MCGNINLCQQLTFDASQQNCDRARSKWCPVSYHVAMQKKSLEYADDDLFCMGYLPRWGK